MQAFYSKYHPQFVPYNEPLPGATRLFKSIKRHNTLTHCREKYQLFDRSWNCFNETIFLLLIRNLEMEMACRMGEIIIRNILHCVSGIARRYN